MSEGESAGSSGGAQSMESGSDESAADGQENQENEESDKVPVKAKPKKLPKMRALKINGVEEYIDEDKVIRDYQKYRAGDSKLKEAHQKIKEAEELQRRLADDPYSVYKDSKYSAKFEEAAERILMEKYDREMNPPDPRDEEMEDYKKRLKDYEDRDTTIKEEAEASQKQQFIESRKVAISQVLHEAMSASHLSADPQVKAEMLRDLAVYMRAAKERGEQVTPQELVENYHGLRMRQYFALCEQHSGDELLDILGERTVNKMNKASIERIKKARNQPSQSYRNETKSSRSPSGNYIDPSDAIFAIRNGR